MSGEKYFFGKPADPSTRDCGWCRPPEPAVVAFEVYRPRKKIGTATYVYACGRHRNIAREMSRAPRAAA